MNKIYFSAKFLAIMFFGAFTFQFVYFLPELIKGTNFSEGWFFMYFTFFSIATILGYFIFNFISYLVGRRLSNVIFQKKIKNCAFILGFLVSLIIGVMV